MLFFVLVLYLGVKYNVLPVLHQRPDSSMVTQFFVRVLYMGTYLNRSSSMVWWPYTEVQGSRQPRPRTSQVSLSLVSRAARMAVSPPSLYAGGLGEQTTTA